MFIKPKKLIAVLLTSLATFNVMTPVFSLENYEEGNWGVRKIKLTPKGRIKITLCNAWGAPSGYIDIGGKPYYVSDASKITNKKIVWNTSDKFKRKKTYNVNSSNLLATQRNSKNNRKFVVPINIGCNKGFFITGATGSSVTTGASAATVGAGTAGAAAAGTAIVAGSTSAAVIAPVVVGAGLSAAAIAGAAVVVGAGIAAGSSGSGSSSSN